MPPTPEQPRFSSLLFELGAPFNASARLSALGNLGRALLRKVSARMLIIDEVHHLLAGNYRERRALRPVDRANRQTLRHRMGVEQRAKA
nr:TniB family NTP-binding protein [Cupriavidus oxalaticus]